jgi:hypothetical protein
MMTVGRGESKIARGFDAGRNGNCVPQQPSVNSLRGAGDQAQG